ncbi:hypothetical protein DTO006G1_4747 [Penicillium roqueforti]|uniref:uncharacterized protein n=1 Tax=Penicillium roqueforti TaxID=5082 RepID=UPI0019098A99|nr:uncharacterized protein LCP9604111_9278 [Penicillium roqueforti]KAF9239046.1 hypothetical protein LCP9604111_9278 [Penicillium roqueforti]KAI1830050.1 hypothetical protein CBS147337_9102 [Penicillium roqueforti]KAI2726635.1 hypothetical protein CBS147354_4350 [Penicillium roqueforti]KAI2760204.1 hypothetical protein DTO006G1_4747 [Penicillium roqueforti]KAI3100430.1 hypothetical protein CBS147333_8436 [Penicillium roqueforti]
MNNDNTTRDILSILVVQMAPNHATDESYIRNIHTYIWGWELNPITNCVLKTSIARSQTKGVVRYQYHGYLVVMFHIFLLWLLIPTIISCKMSGAVLSLPQSHPRGR